MTTSRLSVAFALAVAVSLAGLPLPTAAAARPAARTAAPHAAKGAPSVVTLARPSGREWFGVYVIGKKAGWSWVSFGREKRGAAAVLVGRTETTISAQVGPREVERSSYDEKVYEAKPGGRMLSFHSRRSGDGGSREIVGRCTPAECVVTISGEGEREQRRIPNPGETADDADGPRLVAATHAPLDGAQLDVDRLRKKTMQTRFVSREKIAAAGVETPVSIVEEREVGPEGDRLATRVTIADDGRVLEIRIGDVVAKAEPEDTARRLDKVDLFGLTRVKLKESLPQDVPATLRYRIRGLPKPFRVEDARQQFAALDGDDVALTVTAAIPSAADPAHDPPRGRAPKGEEGLLAATADVDSDNAGIRKLAAQIVGDTPGVYAAARKIEAAVYKRLEKVYGVSRDRASEVLATGKGDCTEHTLLFTALARAAGIPARQVHGLVFARYGDGVPALYWHAWPEILAGSEWIALDPTFGQEVADATHLALGRGPQADTVSLMGALQVIDVTRVR